jgi:hypothetical protein
MNKPGNYAGLVYINYFLVIPIKISYQHPVIIF